MNPSTELLTVETVLDYLRAQGVGENLTDVAELGGGVSNVVLRVGTVDGAIIVKQSLPRLRVAEEWFAPQERILNEAEAMRLATTFVSDGVPEVLLSDDKRFVLAMRSAPPSWTDWKVQLMAGHVNEAIAGRVGTLLGTLHRSTLDEQSVSPRLSQTEPFEQLRLRPYYEHAARARPRWAAVLSELADELRGNRRCLVHGDFSPKNILAPVEENATRAWMIDFEVAHRGDPRFDLAFLLTHLTLKAIHLPSASQALDGCARAFLSSYSASAGSELSPDTEGTLRQAGALLLARVYGKSPAEYLTDAGRGHTERLAEIALGGRISTLEELTMFREDTR